MLVMGGHKEIVHNWKIVKIMARYSNMRGGWDVRTIRNADMIHKGHV